MARHRRSIVPASAAELQRLDAGEQISPASALWSRLSAGGPAGNERLTAVTAASLLALLAIEGVTIIQLRQLIWLHLFVGMALVPAVALKLASTGWRFIRYYTGSEPYVRKGPPHLIMRASAPFLILSTVAVLGTGVALLLAGPGSRDTVLPLHKLSFFIWLGFFALPVLVHVTGVPAALRAEYRPRGRGAAKPAGRAGRSLAVAVALAAGVILAVAVLPQFSPWQQPAIFAHHHHHLRGESG
jgi:hypothetical protein